MKNKCNVIRDILPLYIEQIVSEDTRIFVEEHLASCTECSSELEHMKKPAEFTAKMAATPLKNLKRKLYIKKAQTIAFTASLILVIMLLAFAILTSPQYLPYSHDLLHVEEKGDGILVVTFSDEVTGFKYLSTKRNDNEPTIYDIEAWNTLWDVYFSENKTHEMVIKTNPNEPFAAYYVQNNGELNIFIHGKDPNPGGGTITLPRLFLGPYFHIATIASVVLSVTLILFRKNETARICIERILLLPVSYMLGHLCTKGIAMSSYSATRDFFIIVLVAIPIYCILLFGISLYRMKRKE